LYLMRDLRWLCCLLGRGRWTRDRRSVLKPQMGWRLQQAKGAYLPSPILIGRRRIGQNLGQWRICRS
jgi:hypothetical protein